MKNINTVEQLVRVLSSHSHIIIYGAGMVGKLLAERLSDKKYGLQILCFAVTDASVNQPDILGIPVRSIHELSEYAKDSIVIIATLEKLHNTIQETLRELFFEQVLCVNSQLYADLRQTSDSLNSMVEHLQKQVNELTLTVETLYTLLNYSVDITRIPPAGGDLRMLQTADAVLLGIFHQICEKHGVLYWLDYGTLLGAVRHGGFVPWDDDLDVGMLRKDYDMIAGILREELEQYGFTVNQGVGYYEQIIRVLYKDTPVQLDIWPYDFYDKNVREEAERKELSKNIKLCNQKFYETYKLSDIKEGISQFSGKALMEFQREIIFKRRTAVRPQAVFGGSEVITYPEPNIFPYETVFPLHTVSFEEITLKIPHIEKEYLRCIYGDYLTYPRNKVNGHKDISKKREGHTQLPKTCEGKITLAAVKEELMKLYNIFKLQL